MPCRTRSGLSGFLVLICVTFIAPVAYAGDNDGDATEHQSFMSSTVSLADAVTAAEAHTNARAMSAEFEREDGVYIFEIELLTVSGAELEAHVDASTGAVLQVETEEDEEQDSDESEND